jgi:hypothetical protein
LEVESGLSQHRFTGYRGPCKLRADFDRPIMVLISLPGEGNQETSVGDGIHPRENPFRDETSRGPPLMIPANLRHTCSCGAL